MPVENRYAFTDFSELKFNWKSTGTEAGSKAQFAPGARGELRSRFREEPWRAIESCFA